MFASWQAFDGAADGYDRQFTHSRIGRMLRTAVWARCAARFATGSRILEMNCGTGEDALHLTGLGLRVLATDVSPAMLAIARGKAQTARAPDTLRFSQLAWEDLGELDEPAFDGVLSNFGGLNCVADLAAVASALAPRLRPGAWALLCLMGRHVPWEWLWYLSQGRVRKAFRRLSTGGVAWNGIRIYYPTPAQVQRVFDRQFHCARLGALGTLLPPPYTEGFWSPASRLIAMLERGERSLETLWPLPWLADHFLIELQRR